MVEGGGGTVFPVIFFDGEREINIGNIKIEAKQVYKSFQFMLAHKIGISPNQISIYLIDRKNSKSPETRRKFPITAKANFSQICRERDCSILVVLKRSRKTRSRKALAPPLHGGFDVGEYEFPAIPMMMPEKVILLRRDQAFYDQAASEDLDSLNARLQNNLYISQNGFPKMEVQYPMMMMRKKPMQRYFCEECTIAKKNGRMADFHHCVNDVVVEDFRIAGAGPIGPVRW